MGIEHLPAGSRQSGLHIRLAPFGNDEDHAATAASATYLPGQRAGLPRHGHEPFNGRCGNLGRQLPPVVPFLFQCCGHRAKVTGAHGSIHRPGQIPDPRQSRLRRQVALDVPLENFPVVRAGKVRLPGVADHDVGIQPRKPIGRQRLMADAPTPR